MAEETLTSTELAALIQRVFKPRPEDTALAILVDLPDDDVEDNPEWHERRRLAVGWARELTGARNELALDIDLICYQNVRSNNADLPTTGWLVDLGEVPDHVCEVDPKSSVEVEEVLGKHQLVLAPTEFSTTAPLKMLAPKLGFRAATMPKFSTAMVPALRLDYTEVDHRVRMFKGLLDRSVSADIEFLVDDDARLPLHLDLRHRFAHASGGLFPEPGVAGNLPSGEAYIVPYEGEHDGDPSSTAGFLPIQFQNEVVVFRVEHNTVTGVESTGQESSRQNERIDSEPAAGNVAELGLGVLGDFGIEPIGEVLLDEKLGLHIALGRSEHFGGQVGPEQFSSPQAVVHQDYVYLPELQPRVMVAEATLTLNDGSSVELMRNGKYIIDFDSGL